MPLNDQIIQPAQVIGQGTSGSGSGSSAFGDITGWPGTSTDLVRGDGSDAPLSAADIPNLAASKITSGQLALARGGTNADLSATGGAGQVLRQASSGAAVTVAALTTSEIYTALGTPVACQAYRSSNQSLTADAATAIEFNAEAYDPSSMHDNSTNPHRFTAPVDGIYEFSATLMISNTSGIAGDIYINVVVNGTTTRGLGLFFMGASSKPTISVRWICSLLATEWVAWEAYPNEAMTILGNSAADSSASSATARRIA